jgi:hypothetical protein
MDPKITVDQVVLPASRLNPPRMGQPFHICDYTGFTWFLRGRSGKIDALGDFGELEDVLAPEMP